jgi:N6-adenosine-specific RNA methylase IME4
VEKLLSSSIVSRSDAEWRKYIKEAERGSVEATLEWCRRVHEAKQAYGGSFRSWAEEWYSEYSYSVLSKLAKVGAENQRLVFLIKKHEITNDYNVLYETTTLTDDEIAELPALDQKTIKDYKQRKKRGEPLERNVTPPTGKLDNAPYSIIYADPPWEYNDKANNTGHWAGALNHYDTLTPADVAALELEPGRHVTEYVAPNAALFLWVTFPLLPHAFSVMEAWGFEYKTAGFVWVKTNADGTPYMGLGNTTRQNAELCLYGKRGKGIARIDASVQSVILKQRTRHSAKPAVARDRITQLFGNVPKIELFAREAVDGWDYWGNKVPQAEMSYG